MDEPKPTGIRSIKADTVVIDPRLAKSRFHGSFNVKTGVFTPAEEGAVEISEQSYNTAFNQKEDTENAHNENN